MRNFEIVLERALLWLGGAVLEVLTFSWRAFSAFMRGAGRGFVDGTERAVSRATPYLIGLGLFFLFLIFAPDLLVHLIATAIVFALIGLVLKS